MLDRVTGGRGALAIKYSMVSVVGVVITQTLLVLLVGILGHDPTWSNVVAVMITAVPVFLLNKRWVWSHDGRSASGGRSCRSGSSRPRASLLSTGFVAVAHRVSETARCW